MKDKDNIKGYNAKLRFKLRMSPDGKNCTTKIFNKRRDDITDPTTIDRNTRVGIIMEVPNLYFSGRMFGAVVKALQIRVGEDAMAPPTFAFKGIDDTFYTGDGSNSVKSEDEYGVKKEEAFIKREDSMDE